MGKAYINVSGTGTVKIDDWHTGFFDKGDTIFTLNGGGTLIAYGDWTSDTTLEGKLTSDNNVIAVLWPENTSYTKLTTDACGAIPAPDMDKDCDVDFADYASFAEGW